jgi:hypothetical protein
MEPGRYLFFLVTRGNNFGGGSLHSVIECIELRGDLNTG